MVESSPGKDSAPSPSAGDVIHASVRGALGAIPFVGAAASEFFSLILAPPLAKRRDQFLSDLAADIEALSETVKEFEPSNLAANETFISAVLTLAPAAVRSADQEKLQALRNAALNCARPTAFREDLAPLFLELVSSLTAWHIRIMKYLESPMAWFTERNLEPAKEFTEGGEILAVVGKGIPEIPKGSGLFAIVIHDLSGKGLTTIDSVLEGVHRPAAEFSTGYLSGFGKEVLAFIQRPVELVTHQSNHS